MKYFAITNLIFIFFLSVSANAGLMKIGSITAVLTSQKTAEIQIDSGAGVQTIENVIIGNKQNNCDVKVTKNKLLKLF